MLNKLTNKIMQLVDASSPTKDRWLTLACMRPWGTQGRSVLMLWRWQKRTRQQGSNDELVLLV